MYCSAVDMLVCGEIWKFMRRFGTSFRASRIRTELKG